MARILIVEDDEMSRDMISRRLARRGHDVCTASDGEQGVDTAQIGLPDLILMDMSLPVIDGWDATRRLKSDPATAHIPIIALSAHVRDVERDRALEAGCDAYETKPVDLAKLLETMERVLSAARTPDPPAPDPPAPDPDAPESSTSDPGTRESSMTEHDPTEPATEPPVPAAEEGLIETERLEAVARDCGWTVTQLVTLYVEQTTTQFGDIATAFADDDLDEVQRFAHSGAGAAGTCGVDAMVTPMRLIEDAAAEHDTPLCAEVIRAAEERFAVVRAALEALASAS